jgi:hydroxymethylpyrimidine pyrophosphatase-like HAD family hydrolase
VEAKGKGNAEKRISDFLKEAGETDCNVQTTDRWIEDKFEQLLLAENDEAENDENATKDRKKKLLSQPPHSLPTVANGLQRLLGEATTIPESSQPHGMEIIPKDEGKGKKKVEAKDSEKHIGESSGTKKDANHDNGGQYWF